MVLDRMLWVKKLLLRWIFWQIAPVQTTIEIVVAAFRLHLITVMAKKAQNRRNHQKTK